MAQISVIIVSFPNPLKGKKKTAQRAVGELNNHTQYMTPLIFKYPALEKIREVYSEHTSKAPRPLNKEIGGYFPLRNVQYGNNAYLRRLCKKAVQGSVPLSRHWHIHLLIDKLG